MYLVGLVIPLSDTLGFFCFVNILIRFHAKPLFCLKGAVKSDCTSVYFIGFI